MTSEQNFRTSTVPDRIGSGSTGLVLVDFNTILDVETVRSIAESPLAPSNLLGVDAVEPLASHEVPSQLLRKAG